MCTKVITEYWIEVGVCLENALLCPMENGVFKTGNGGTKGTGVI